MSLLLFSINFSPDSTTERMRTEKFGFVGLALLLFLLFLGGDKEENLTYYRAHKTSIQRENLYEYIRKVSLENKTLKIYLFINIISPIFHSFRLSSSLPFIREAPLDSHPPHSFRCIHFDISNITVTWVHEFLSAPNIRFGYDTLSLLRSEKIIQTRGASCLWLFLEKKQTIE